MHSESWHSAGGGADEQTGSQAFGTPGDLCGCHQPAVVGPRLKLCGLTTSCPPAATNGWIPETQERFGWGRGDGQSVNRRHRGLDGHARCQSGHRDDPRPPLQQGTVTSPAHMWGLLRPLSGMLMSCDPSEQSRRDAPPPHWPGSLLDYLLHTACFACCAHLLSSF